LNRQLIETWTVSTLSGEDHAKRLACAPSSLILAKHLCAH
jgi:hypothetical protein